MKPRTRKDRVKPVRDVVVIHPTCPRFLADQARRVKELAERQEAGVPLFPKKRKGGAE